MRNPFPAMWTWLKARFTRTNALDKALAPFAKARDTLSAVEAQVRAQEQTLRTQAAALLAQADEVAKQVQSATTARAKLTEMLGQK